MNKEKQRYQIYITAEVMKELKHLCLEEGINTSQMIEKLIMEKIKKENKDD